MEQIYDDVRGEKKKVPILSPIGLFIWGVTSSSEVLHSTQLVPTREQGSSVIDSHGAFAALPCLHRCWMRQSIDFHDYALIVNVVLVTY